MHERAQHSSRVLEHKEELQDTAGKLQENPPEASFQDSSGSSSEDRDGDNDFQDFVPTSAAVGSGSRRRSSGHLNFVDLVSAGIGSYLAGLEAKQKDSATVYSRSTGTESSRWRKCLEMLSNKYAKRPVKDLNDESARSSNHERVVLKRPCDGRPTRQELGPCVPPTGLEFEHFPGADGLPRLSFCSSFESGNLAVAQCEGPDLYTLLVDVDANTDGYTQWFYFAVQGGSCGLKVTFRLVNMAKSGSLFGEKGMKPAVWSEKSGRGWERGCADVSYLKSAEAPAKQPLMSGQKQWYTLSFSYTFEYDDDTVFFAYHYPYTYSHLCDFIDALEAHPYAGSLFSRRVLCHTIGDLPCEVLDVDCDPPDSPTDRGIAVITARVHPGESNASWMMHGFMSFLLSPAAEAKALRQAFKWLIVPTLNPEGVVRGCYRCGLAGTDLNRVYAKPSKILHPEIYHLKETIKRAGRTVELFIDFHGHSKKEGIFFYGGKAEDRDRNADIRLLPRLCCLGSSDFKWRKCAFNLNESKMSTARLVGFRELGIQRVYTVEASFAGSGQAVLELEAEASEVSEASEASEASDAVGGAQEGQEEKSALEEHQEQIKEAATVLLQQFATHERGESVAAGGTAMRKGTRSDLAQVQQSFRRRSLRQMTSRSGSEEDLKSPKEASPVNPRPSHLRQPSCPVSPNGPTNPRMSGASSPKAAQSASKELPAKSREKVKQNKRRASEMGEEHPESISNEFNPKRLELAGPTIGRAICAVWQLEVPAADQQPLDGFLDGTESKQWPHLHYHRLKAEAAQRELSKLLSGRVGHERNGDDDDGSDSNPSADEKPVLELRKLQRRLARKSKRQKTFKFVAESEPEEEIKYRVVVAFGKAVKIPIRGGGSAQKGTKIGDAVEKLIKRNGERRASTNDMSRHHVEHSSHGGDANRARSESPERSPQDSNDSMAPSPRCSKPNPNLLLPAMLGSPNPRAMLRRWTRTSESSIVPGASSNQHSDEEPFDTEPSDCPWPVIKTDKSAQLHVIDLQVCGSPSSRAASPTGNSVVGEGSPIEDSSPVCDESMFAAPTDGTDPSSSPLRTKSRRRPGSAVQEGTRPIVYSPGVPPVTGSNAGGSTIQIELPASVAVEVTDKRPVIHQVRTVAASVRARTPDVAETKLSHVTLPDIPGRFSDAERPPVQSFKDWVEREDGTEARRGHSPPKVARPRTPAAQKVTRILSGPASSVRTDPDPQKDHPERGAAEEMHVTIVNDEVDKKSKMLSKVSVHFKTSQPSQPTVPATAAKVTPHVRRVGRSTLPKGQVQETLQLRPDGEQTVSDAPLSQRAIFKDDSPASSPAARPHSAERWKVTRAFPTGSPERKCSEAKVALLELCGSSIRASGTVEDPASSAWEFKQPWHLHAERHGVHDRQRAVSQLADPAARSCAGRLRKGGWPNLNTE